MTAVDEILGNIQTEGLNRPYITLTYAQSLDGSIALSRGKWLKLSGPKANQLTHRLRAAHDGILVGVGTVQSDDPRLTTRGVEGPDPQPIILDSNGKIAQSAQVFSHPKKPWLFIKESVNEKVVESFSALGVRVFPVSADNAGYLDLKSAISKSYQNGIRSIMVEGGAKVIQSFIKQKLVDLIVITIAPVFVGGLTAFESPLHTAHPNIDGYPFLEDLKVAQFDPDLVVWGRLSR